MKFFDFFKKMTKRQKIIICISTISVFVVVTILFTVVVTKGESKVEETFSKSEKKVVIRDDLEGEEPVVLQETEEVSEEQLEKEQVKPEEVKTGKASYYIKVNYGANTVTVYGKDEEGNYTVPVKAMICSCGRATPKGGVYKTSDGYKWGTLIGGVYGQYSTRIVGSILFHSVPYTAQSPDSLEYWEFDKLGTTASAGCVRLMVEDSRWIYNNCRGGTMVEFYSSDDPGPLGKPGAPKISDNERCRGWDPTDPSSGNPWRDEVQEVVEEPVQDQVSQPEVPVEQTKPTENNKSQNTSKQTESKQVKNTVTPPANKTVKPISETSAPTNTVNDEHKGNIVEESENQKQNEEPEIIEKTEEPEISEEPEIQENPETSEVPENSEPSEEPTPEHEPETEGPSVLENSEEESAE